MSKGPKIAHDRASAIASSVKADIEPMLDVCEVAGSLRRNRPEIGDIEFVVLPKNHADFMEWCKENGFSGGQKIQKGSRNGRKIEFYISPDRESVGSMLFTYTGDFQFNIAMRRRAKNRGLKVNQYGVFNQAGKKLASETEEQIFKVLEKKYYAPEDRSFSNRGGKK